MSRCPNVAIERNAPARMRYGDTLYADIYRPEFHSQARRRFPRRPCTHRLCGAVLDLMVHDIDALNSLLGTHKTVYARGRESWPGSWDHMQVILDYGDSRAAIDAGVLMPSSCPFTMALQVLCERGSVEFVFRAGGASVDMGGGITSLVGYEAANAYRLKAVASPRKGEIQ
jgi:predicted dehydrogenase